MSTTSEGQQAIDSLNGKLTFEYDANRIIGRDEGNLPRLLVLANGTDFVMKISKEGFDVLVATDDQLLFNSGQNLPKIVETGTATIPAATAGTGTTVVVPHSVGDIPIVWGFLDSGATNSPLPYYNIDVGPGADAGKVLDIQGWYADASNVTFFTNAILQGVGAIPIRYYIFQETAAV